MRRLKKFLDAYLHRFKLGSLRLKRKIVTEKKKRKIGYPEKESSKIQERF